jgi:hypothetical protein
VIGQPATAPHHQPATGARIAEIPAARPAAQNQLRQLPAGPRQTGPVRSGAQRLHRLAVLRTSSPSSKAGNPGFADRKRTENQGTVQKSTCRQERGLCRSGGHWTGIPAGRGRLHKNRSEWGRLSSARGVSHGPHGVTRPSVKLRQSAIDTSLSIAK